jgi:hypothetical protein
MNRRLNQRGETSGNSVYGFKYSEWAINNAASNGHINALDWFYNSDYEFKYSRYAGDIVRSLDGTDILKDIPKELSYYYIHTGVKN